MNNKEYNDYLKKIKLSTIKVIIIQIFILLLFITFWQLLSEKNYINTFLFSSPKNIIKTIKSLLDSNDLFIHIYITLKEIFISFIISAFISIIISAILWWNKTLAKIIDPYLTIINSLPKVALGPIIIIWAGANQKSIILMALLITIFSSIINIYTAFKNTNKISINLLKSFKASKLQIFLNVVFPSNINMIISTLKINLSMTFVGVIMGELLVSKQGLGYLINYGSQVFNINLVMSSIFILCILTSILYLLLVYIERKLKKKL